MDNMPLMKPVEIEMMEKYLSKELTMLEYGSGSSTSFYAERVKSLTSVEYNPRWFEKVRNDLISQGHNNVEMILIPCPQEKPAKYMTYVDYINWPMTQQERFWDLVLIDGRARQWVAETVLPRITKDSVVFVHDWGPIGNPNQAPKRPRYNSILNDYEVIDQAHTLVALKKK